MAVKFDANSEEFELSHRIARRAVGITGGNIISRQMDIIATHLNGCPLRLQEFADADDFNFAHDIVGIQKHLNRDTGQLDGLFVPRFAA